MDLSKQCRRYHEAIKALEKLRPEPSTSDLMRERIERAIAVTTIATTTEIHAVYTRLGSWDDVVVAAEKTCEGRNIWQTVEDILAERWRAVRLEEAGRKGEEAGILLREIAAACMKLADGPDIGRRE